MPQYYAVGTKLGIYTLNKPDGTLFKPFPVAAFKNVSMNAIVNYFNITDKLHLFADQKSAIAYANEHSASYDTLGTFSSEPVFIVNSNANIEITANQKDGVIVNKAGLTLVSAKMIHVGDQFAENLPYHAIDEVNANNANSTAQVANPKDFHSVKAAFVMLLSAFIMHSLNNDGKGSSPGFNVMAAIIGLALYFNYSQKSATAQADLDMKAEIASQLSLSKRF